MEDKFGLFEAYGNANSLMSKKLEIVSEACIGGGALLDIGCGTGEFISRVRTKFKSVVGIDLDDDLLAFSRKRFVGDAGIRIVKLGAANIAKFGANKFDCVSALDVIEHLGDPKAVLRTIFNSLKPGGHFLMTTPNWYDKINIRLHPDSPHKSAHSSLGWKRLVKEAGFSIESVRTVRFPILNRETLNKRVHLFGMCVVIVAKKPI